MPRGGPVFRHEVVRRPRAVESLTSSAKVFSNGPGAQSIRKTGRRTRSNEYQNELWDFYDTVPEYRFACSWVGNLLSKAKLEVHRNGEVTTDQVALDALASLFGGPEGQEEMLRLLGINFTVAGEGYVVGTDGGRGDDDWRVIAAVEVSNTGDTITIEQEPMSDDQIAIRMWKSHPRSSGEPDSPSRALIPVLGEVVRLTQVVAAQADSRLTSAGILWVPQEMEIPAVPVVMNDGDGEKVSQQVVQGAEGLTQRLVRIASISIGDRSSAAANVPLVIAAPGEFLEKIQKTEFWSGFDEHARELRDEAIRRIGIGMDMPPEVLTGTADVNHWGAWQIEEAAIKAHTEPLLSVIVASLTTGYLHAFLEASGVENYQEYTFEANTSALRLRPNRSKEAMELWDRGALNVRTLLIENGFDPDADQPDEQERMYWYLAKIAGGSTTPDQVAAALQQLGISNIPGTVEPEQESQEAPEPRSLTQHPNRSAPNPEESEADDALAASAMFVVDGLVLASEAHVHRALERAGNRLKNVVGVNLSCEAADLYMSCPTLDYAECESLLEDAWSRLDRFEYPGVSTARLREALHEYTLMLLRSQKPLTRASLSRHLLLELSDRAA